MLVYRTPTVTAFRKRKIFHAIQKESEETISDWFKRLQQLITDCEYDLTAECILIDKFVSGLDESDFQKISQVASWTLDDLILVVIGNTHIFSKFPVKDNQPQEQAISNVKSEAEHQWSDAENGANADFQNNSGENEIADEAAVNAVPNEIIHKPMKKSRKKESRQANCEKNRRYLQRLRETGHYEDYKKKQAEIMRRRRLKMKQTEQYLPPEIQLHMLNERRRATRERVKRYRDRKSKKTTGKKDKKSNSKSKRKIPPKPEFVSEPLASEPEDWLEDNSMNYDFDLNPIVEIEEKTEIVKEEPQTEPELERESIAEPARVLRACRVDVKKEAMPVTKPKSKYIRKRTFECYRCSLPCSKLYELRAHIQIFHPCTIEEPKKEVLSCPYCTKTTISREILSRHLRKNHATLQMHKCPCCDEQFKKRGELTEHLTQHRDYRPYICETCASAFRTVSELNAHRRRHTGQKHGRCDVCGMQFASRGSLKGHMMIHTGERPYSCTLCDQRFRQSSSVSKHLLTVHKQGEKKYVCTTCGKRFASIYHLRIHDNIHTGARPYQCEYCESDFNQPSALKTHVNRIHLNLPDTRKKPQPPQPN